MRLSAVLIIVATFLAAAAASFVAASFSVTLIEDNSEIGVRSALDANEMPWAEVQADGLRVTMSGTAPTEALRFKALSTAGSIVDAARVTRETGLVCRATIEIRAVTVLTTTGGPLALA